MMMKDITYKQLITKFLLFLKQENAYDGYFEALKTQKKHEFRTWENYINPFSIPSLKICFDGKIYHLNDIVDLSFTWSRTKEGQDYWADINDKWAYKSRELQLISQKL